MCCICHGQTARGDFGLYPQSAPDEQVLHLELLAVSLSRYHDPSMFGWRDWARISDLLTNSQLLLPAELHANKTF